MLLLDTNVVSELRRVQSGRAVPGPRIEAVPFAAHLVRGVITNAGLGLAGVPVGFYLLRKGRLVGFDAAIATLEELKASADVGLGAGIVGLILGVDGARSLRTGATVASTMWGVGAAARAFSRFSDIIDSVNASETWKRYNEWWPSQQRQQREVNEDRLAKACRLPGIEPDATRG